MKSPLSYTGLSVLLLLCAVCLLNVLSMRNKSYTHDEGNHYAFGAAVLMGTLEKPSAQRMPITALNALPAHVMQRVPAIIGGTEAVDAYPRSRQAVFVSRLPTVMVSLVLAMLIFAWSRELYGSRAGLLSLGLYAFSPDFLAHAHYVTTDLYSAASIFAAVFCFWRVLQKPTWPRLLSSALVTGVAQITKHTALLLFPLFLLLFLAHAYDQGWLRLKRNSPDAQAWLQGVPALAVRAALYLFIVGFMINVGYGFQTSFDPVREYGGGSSASRALNAKLPDLPIPLPRVYLQALQYGRHINRTGGGHAPNYLLGEQSKLGWWYYFPVALLLKTPLALFGLTALALATLWRKPRGTLIPELFLLVPASMIFVFFSFFTTAQIGVRYLMPMLPFVYVFIGRLLAHGVEARRSIWKLPIAVLSAWYIASVLSFHPHYTAYFNELIGDRKNMYKYLAGSNVDWGQNAHYLEDYLERNRDKTIAVNPSAPTSGTVVVGINELVGSFDRGEPVDAVGAATDNYRWLREHYEPVDHIGYSWLVFEIPREGPR